MQQPSHSDSPRKISRRSAFRGLVSGVLGAALAGCTSGHTQIDFGTIETKALERSETGDGRGPIRLAVAPILSPGRTSTLHQDFSSYATPRLGRPVELIQGKTYLEVNDLVRSGTAPVAMVCTYPYVIGHEDFGMELIAAPVIGGAAEYYSLLIVPADSRARSLRDLSGTSFAFTDPMSNSGRLVPLYQLAVLGWTPESYFSQTIFTYAHDRSVIAVAHGLVAGATVDSVVFDYLAAREPALVARVRVIERWGPYGANPVVVSPRIATGLKADLQRTFLEMSEHADGALVLRRLGVDRYIIIDDRAYDSVREMSSYLSTHGLPR